MGPIQKNTFSRASVLQPKALHLHYFILKVLCLTQYFGQPWMKTIILWGQLHHLFYQVRVKKNVFLTLQFTLVQDPQMLLLPQVQTIVTRFLNMTRCVKFLQIIGTYANTEEGWLYQTLHPVVWTYAARIIWVFFIPLKSVIWLKMYTHFKSSFNGISSSHLPVTRELIFCTKPIW